MSLSFLFNIKNDKNWNPGTIYYYDGTANKVRGVHNEQELKYIQDVYNATNDVPLQSYTWDANFAPVYRRVFGVLQPMGTNSELERLLRELKILAKAYNEIYGKPKKFKAMVAMPIRNEPSKNGEIVGTTVIGTIYDVLDVISICDYDWAQVNYNGKKAWIPMSHVTGEPYGERIK